MVEPIESTSELSTEFGRFTTRQRATLRSHYGDI
jgi:hypothetical protein